MEDHAGNYTDGSSIKAVSSLLSHFESIASSKHHSSASSISKLSLDLPRRIPSRDSSDTEGKWSSMPRGRRQSPSNARPVSMLSIPAQESPPRLVIESPHSPRKSVELLASLPLRPFHHGFLTPLGLQSDSHRSSRSHHFRIPSRSKSPKVEVQGSLQASDLRRNSSHRKASPNEVYDRTSRSPIPPPVNRSAKRKLDGVWEPRVEPNEQVLAGSRDNRKLSPFSTPPSSPENSLSREDPPPIPHRTKPLPPLFRIGNTPRSGTAPTHHTVAGEQRQLNASSALSDGHIDTDIRSTYNSKSTYDDLPHSRPGLPPRANAQAPNTLLNQSQTEESRMRNSVDLPRQSALSLGFSSKASTPSNLYQSDSTTATSLFGSSLQGRLATQSTPKPLAEVVRTPLKITAASSRGAQQQHETDLVVPLECGILPVIATTVLQPTEYPDISQAHRRPPYCPDGPRTISTGSDARIFDVCGEYACTTGAVTRVWSLLTGKILLSMAHDETIKITAIAFKPARRIEEEGIRLWLGTNWGEIQELDIPSKKIVNVNSNAHPRREILRIYRNAAELWTLDDEGKLHVWPPDETGSPNLSHSMYNTRVPRGHAASIVSSSKLWLATGKEVRVFHPSIDTDVASFQVTQIPLSQPNTGTITSCAIVDNKPDCVYFGHADGKITAYSRQDYNCLGIFNVNLYRVSCLVGVGDYLWTGYSNGMICVYDSGTSPWKLMKEWRAHENPVIGIVADRSSMWKLDRMLVVSLGLDNVIGIWDGMLKNDWLDSDMQAHDFEYCDFREVTALVTTWNAGASKPEELRHDEQDSNFIRGLFGGGEPPDIFVIGLQELVDLDDKKETAKNLFRSRNKELNAQETLSSVYRSWRDYFSRCLDELMPKTEPYVLIHTAKLVGLFTCIFVREGERSKIREIQAAEIKTGMGGLHGNKGALIVRVMLEDSSLCFVNCHLAAGQTHTVHRNNDIAAILESTPLPAPLLDPHQKETFICGGDGSMVMDHDICILSGDLNYRIDVMPRDTVVQAVKSESLAKLLERDQLLLSRKKNPSIRLRAFTEGPITFAPTYKYDIGTDDYDSSDKRRVPAWCDRVLYRGTGRIKQTSYNRHEMRLSDHRPVSARFLLRIKTIHPEKREHCWRECEERFKEVKKRNLDDSKSVTPYSHGHATADDRV